MAENNAPFEFQVNDLDPATFEVLRFDGQESLFKPFCYDLWLKAAEHVAFESVVGKLVTLVIQGEAGGRTVQGRVYYFAQTGYDELSRVHYRARIGPEIWRLSKRYDLRVFQNMTVQKIIEQVFTKAKIPEDSYGFQFKPGPEHEYCVQYRESDLDFISRLMEAEGIYYYFDHTDKSQLIITDDMGTHPAIQSATVRLAPRVPTMMAASEYVREFEVHEQVTEDKVTLWDYNPDEPAHPTSDASPETPMLGMEVYDYPGGFSEVSTGGQLAQVWLESFQAQARIGRGTGTCRRFAPGFKFTLDSHPQPEVNREYLIIAERITGINSVSDEDDSKARPLPYQTEFSCIPSNVPYRAPRQTPSPIIPAQTATVVGPSGEEIYTDEFGLGRIKVQFHWDRDGKFDDTSSCWVRVKQTWSGANWGTIFIPRVGMEVVVEWLDDGAQSRPLVTGCVYNGANQPPYPLPAEKTKSTIKTNSSKGGGGFNELRFEDRKGNEQIFIHAEKDMDIRVKNDRREWVGNDRHLFVTRDERQQVKRDRHVTIGRDDMQEIKRDHNMAVKGKQAISITGSRSLTVEADVMESFKKNHSEQVSQDYYLKAKNVVVEAMTALTLKVGGNFITIDSSGIYIKGDMVNLNSGGSALSGTAGNILSPAAPLEAELADTAQPGQGMTYKVQRAQADPAELAALNAPSHEEPEEEAETGEGSAEGSEKTWIEIELVDENGDPIAGERYRMTLPDGTTVAQGRTDEKGVARVKGVDPGECQITFPDLDGEAWEKI